MMTALRYLGLYGFVAICLYVGGWDQYSALRGTLPAYAAAALFVLSAATLSLLGRGLDYAMDALSRRKRSATA